MDRLMRKKIVIIGASGHGKVVADIALKNGYSDIVFIDDNAVGKCMGFDIVGKCTELHRLNDGSAEFIIAIGNNKIRKNIATCNNLKWATLIHPSAQIGTDVCVGEGSVVMAGAVVNPCVKIGKHCIINTCCVVEHDNIIEDYVHISPNAALGGTVFVGESTHIGIGAAVKNNISICKECTLGAGTVAVKDLKESAVYVGVPAKKLV